MLDSSSGNFFRSLNAPLISALKTYPFSVPMMKLVLSTMELEIQRPPPLTNLSLLLPKRENPFAGYLIRCGKYHIRTFPSVESEIK